MRRHRLGRTAVEVTELGFGGAPIGNLYQPLSDDGAAAAVHAAWNGGVRYFDTAPHYGLGLSERRLGAALAGRPRHEFVVSTKVGRLLVPNPPRSGSDLAAGGFAVPDDRTRVLDYSADGVRRSLDASLERLGLDRVDVVYVHDPDRHLDEAISSAIPALIDYRDQGIIGAVGAGMNAWPPLLRIVAESDVDVVMVAGRWTLLDRSAEPLLAECSRRGVSAVAAAPFNSGLLARDDPPADARFDYQQAPPDQLARAVALAATCRQQGLSLPHAAIQFPLRHPAVAAVVAGMRSATEALADARWADTEILEDRWAALDPEGATRLGLA
jgi:D-threo-aldose 1-dehydrogenase